MPSNDNRNFYTFISKTAFETYPVLGQFLLQRGPLFHPVPEGADEGTQPVEMTPLNATLKDAWVAYKGENSLALVRGFILSQEGPPIEAPYETAEYITFGLSEVNMKEVLEIHSAFQQVDGAVYVPILTHTELLHFIKTGEVETL